MSDSFQGLLDSTPPLGLRVDFLHHSWPIVGRLCVASCTLDTVGRSRIVAGILLAAELLPCCRALGLRVGANAAPRGTGACASSHWKVVPCWRRTQPASRTSRW